MRRLGGLFDEIASTINLWRAWREYRRGKRSRPSVLAFEPEADREVIRLHYALERGAYRPGSYRLMLVREPKVRLIAAAPVRDRVVHHAIYRVLAPRLDRRLIDHTYACLPGRGSHRAALRFLRALREHRFALLLDIRHYFLSIDQRILLDVMERYIKDQRLLALLGIIARSGEGLYRRPEVAKTLGLPRGFPPAGCGLPIGNLTSQWWGNHYLSGLDHYVKRELKIPHYQRYLDDFTLFADERSTLEDARRSVIAWLAEERHLRLKHPGAPVRPTTGRFTYLGLRVSRGGMDPRRETLARMRRRVGHLAQTGQIEKLRRSLASYRGLVGLAAFSPSRLKPGE